MPVSSCPVQVGHTILSSSLELSLAVMHNVLLNYVKFHLHIFSRNHTGVSSVLLWTQDLAAGGCAWVSLWVLDFCLLFLALRDKNLSPQSCETLVCTLRMPNGDARPLTAFLSSEADGSGRGVGYTGPGQVWKKKICQSHVFSAPSDEHRVLWSAPR